MNAATGSDNPPDAPRRVLVLGDGGWGTTLALTLLKAGHDVRLWSFDREYAAELARTRRNPRFLPGIELPDTLKISSRVRELTADAELVFCVVPTQYLRSTLTALRVDLPVVPIVSCSKGIEKKTLETPAEIVREVLGDRAKGITVLSGPSHAEELSRDLPTSVVAAGASIERATEVQQLFSGTRLRIYTSPDARGVELAGASKNVIAIGAGISDGLGFGDNSRAALITRGLVEITRLGVALGAHRETFSGLAGMGDLIATCTSKHSRNWTVGSRLGRGESLADIVRSTSMVAEGVETSRSLYQLKTRNGVEMPITSEVYAVLHEEKPAREAVETLMSRPVKVETEDLV